jgi:hypothetical protein
LLPRTGPIHLRCDVSGGSSVIGLLHQGDRSSQGNRILASGSPAPRRAAHRQHPTGRAPLAGGLMPAGAAVLRRAPDLGGAGRARSCLRRPGARSRAVGAGPPATPLRSTSVAAGRAKSGPSVHCAVGESPANGR